MLMPSIIQIRRSTEIYFVGRSPGLNFIKPFIPHCMDFEGPGWYKLFLESPDHAHIIPIPPVDKVVAFLSDPDGKIHNNLRVYLPSATINLFPAFPSKEVEIHVAFYLAQCFQMAGLPIDPRRSIEEACRRPLLEKDIPPVSKKRIILHPGSGGEDKNHPPEFWIQMMIELSKSLLNEKQGFVILLGPAEEKLYPSFRENVDTLKVETVFSPGNEKLLTLLKQAPLYVGHDSGITHLAAMLGTPTIALFKSSSKHQWRPLGPEVRVIKSETSGQDLISKTIQEGKRMLRSKVSG
jgi:hypothetical protein